MARITALAVNEAVQIDARRVGDIVNELGETAAQNLITMALEQMALAITAVERALDTRQTADAVAHADRLSRLAWQIGLPSLAGVAVDVASCAEHGDTGSLAAVRARLMRVGNRSLTEIWDCNDPDPGA